MPVIGETKDRFGRSYIYLNPSPTTFSEPQFSGTVGCWRLRVDDTSTPDPGGGGGGGGDADLSVTGTAAVNIEPGQLLYLNGSNQLDLASASSITTANVVGMAKAAAAAGEDCTYTRNVAEDFFYAGTLVDGTPGNLTPGTVYYLSTTPGNWTATPDTTTSGAVVRSCGLAVDIGKMSIEIQVATVI